LANKRQTIISIIIRTKNEEKWIGPCLDAIYNQKVDADIEVILVDNNSTDYTVQIAERLGIKKLIRITNFIPGKALNDGIKVSKGDYIVCISAHCVPKNRKWLASLLDNFSNDENIGGVYGRQLPLSYTDPIDKRDLLIVFGQDKRIQKKDYFFHNANSMFPRQIWKKFPFSEEASNIEDRVWGKQVIEAGYKIIYEPEAAVFHHHGLHQGNAPERAKGVVSILEKVDKKTLNNIPQIMKPENLNVVAVVPIMGTFSKTSTQFKYLKKTVDYLNHSRYIKSIYYISYVELKLEFPNINWINRKDINKADSLSLNELLMQALTIIESDNNFPDSILYINNDYLNRPKGIIDELILDAQYKGCDTVFPGLVDFGHYWYQNNNNEYEQTDPSLDLRMERVPLFKALYGLGCLSASWLIHQGKMVGGKIGIVKISDIKFAERSLND